MNRLHSHIQDEPTEDLQAPQPLSCRADEASGVTDRSFATGRTRADLIGELAATESSHIAQHSLGMLNATGLLIILTMITGPSPILLGIWALVVSASVILLRRPWRDPRLRQLECRRLLEAIRDADGSEAPLSQSALQSLSALSYPLCGETRETRQLAATLAADLKRAQIKNLPISAEGSGTGADDLPIAAD